MGDRDRTQRDARAGTSGARVFAQDGFRRDPDSVRRQRQAAERGGDFRDARHRRRPDRRRVAGGGRFSGDPARGAGWIGTGTRLMWTTLLIVLHVLVALAIIGLVL